MVKDISVPPPSILAGFGRVDSKSSKKLYKLEPESATPSICVPKTPLSIRLHLLSESAMPYNTIEKKL